MTRSWLQRLLRFLFGILTHVCVEGLEQIPPYGPGLLAANHLSRLDSVLILSVVERNDITGLVADKYKNVPILNSMVKTVNGIWINRERTDFHALRAAVEYVKQGGILGLAPEGTRSKTGTLMPAKTGAAYLADRAGVPIIPVAIWGSESAIKQLTRLRRPVINMHIGTPFQLPHLGRGDRSAGLQRNSDEIMCRIAMMLPPAYRGVYADHPRLKELLGQAI